MKGFGVFFFITLFVYSGQSLASQRCQSVFASFEETTVIKRIDKKSHLHYSDYMALVRPQEALDPHAKDLASQLINAGNFFAAYRSQLLSKGKNLSEKELKELGDTLISVATSFAETSGLKFRLEKNIIVILPEGPLNLNQEAKLLKEKHGVDVIYNPYELIEADAEGFFSKKSQELTISGEILVNGSIFNDAIGKHELTHMRTHEFLKERSPYLFYGEAFAIAGQLPGRQGPYNKYLSFDEMDAFFTSAAAKMDSLINFKKESKDLINPLDRLTLRMTDQVILDVHLESGHLVSVRSELLFQKSIESINKNFESVEITRKKDIFYAHIKAQNEGNPIVVKIPMILENSKITLQEFKKLLIDHLNQKRLAAIYYRNMYKVGMDLMAAIKHSSPEEGITSLKKYKKIFKRYYDFGSRNEIPTQKELALSLE